MKTTKPSVILLAEAMHETCLQKTKRGMRIPIEVIALVCLAVSLPAWAKSPMITVNNATNECGGVIYVSGSGFTKDEEVQISVTNAPGHAATEKIGTAVGKVKNDGKFTIKIPYSTDPYSSLPGCSNGSSVLVKFTATEAKSKKKASADAYMKNCGIIWTGCPA